MQSPDRKRAESAYPKYFDPRGLSFAPTLPNPALQSRRSRPVVWTTTLILLTTTIFALRWWDPCWPLNVAGPEDPRGYAGAACTMEWGRIDSFSNYDKMLQQFRITLPAQAQNVRFLFESHSSFNEIEYQLYLKFSAPGPALNVYLNSSGAGPSSLADNGPDQEDEQDDYPALDSSWNPFFGVDPLPTDSKVYGWSKVDDPDDTLTSAILAIPAGNQFDVYTLATFTG